MDNFTADITNIDEDSIVKNVDYDPDGSKSRKVLEIIDKMNKKIAEIETGASEDNKVRPNGQHAKISRWVMAAGHMFAAVDDSDEESDSDDAFYVAREVIDQLKNDENNLEYFHAEDKLKPLLLTASKYGHICGGYVRDVLVPEKPGPFNDIDLWFTDDIKFMAFYNDTSKDGLLVRDNELGDYDISLKVYRFGYYRDNNLVTRVDAVVSEHFHGSDFNIHKLVARMTDNGPEFVSLGPTEPQYAVEVLRKAINERKALVLPEFYAKWRKGNALVRYQCHARIERLKKKGWDVDESEKDYKHIEQRVMALGNDVKRIALEGAAIVDEGNENVKRLQELLVKQTVNSYEFVTIMNDSLAMLAELDEVRNYYSSDDE